MPMAGQGNDRAQVSGPRYANARRQREGSAALVGAVAPERVKAQIGAEGREKGASRAAGDMRKQVQSYSFLFHSGATLRATWNIPQKAPTAWPHLGGSKSPVDT